MLWNIFNILLGIANEEILGGYGLNNWLAIHNCTSYPFLCSYPDGTSGNLKLTDHWDLLQAIVYLDKFVWWLIHRQTQNMFREDMGLKVVLRLSITFMPFVKILVTSDMWISYIVSGSFMLFSQISWQQHYEVLMSLWELFWVRGWLLSSLSRPQICFCMHLCSYRIYLKKKLSASAEWLCSCWEHLNQTWWAFEGADFCYFPQVHQLESCLK